MVRREEMQAAAPVLRTRLKKALSRPLLQVLARLSQASAERSALGERFGGGTRLRDFQATAMPLAQARKQGRR